MLNIDDIYVDIKNSITPIEADYVISRLNLKYLHFFDIFIQKNIEYEFSEILKSKLFHSRQKYWKIPSSYFLPKFEEINDEITAELKLAEREILNKEKYLSFAKQLINDKNFIEKIGKVNRNLIEKLLVFIQNYVYNNVDASIGDITRTIENNENLWQEVKSNNIFLLSFVDHAVTKLCEIYEKNINDEVKRRYLEEYSSLKNQNVETMTIDNAELGLGVYKSNFQD